MRRRRLGRTGLEVSDCTLGTSALAASGSDPAEARATVAHALDRGVDAIELDAGSAATIGVLRDAVAGDPRRHDLHVFARVTSRAPFDLPSPHVPADCAYPGRHIRAETEALLAALAIERLAVVQLHAWCPEWLHEGDWLDTLARLRDEGKIAGVGISLFDHDIDAGQEAVASGMIDTLQVMVNIFDQGALSTLLPLACANDVGVIARSPLYYGALGASADGRLRDFPRDDWRSGYFFDDHRRETEARAERLARDVAAPDRSVSDTALRFCLSPPAVSTVAVGVRTRAQLDATVAALDRGPLDDDTCAALARHRWLC